MEQFELIKKVLPPNDEPYWLDQELCRELKFNYDKFLGFITDGIASCQHHGYDISLHFTPTEEGYQLSQYACYLVVEKLPIEDIDYHKQVKNYFYTKNFSGWSVEKPKVDGGIYEPKGGPRWVKEKEIWNTKWGVNIGSEEDGKGRYLRPVLILKTFGPLYLVAPLTSKGQEGDHPAAHFYHKLTSVSFENCESFVMLNQIKVIDKKRCIRKMEKINSIEFKLIKKLLRNLYFPED